MKKIKFSAVILAILFIISSAFINNNVFTYKQYGPISRTTDGTNYTYTFADTYLVSQNPNLVQECTMGSGIGCIYTLDFDAISGETRSNLTVGSETVINGMVVYTVSIASAPHPDSDGGQEGQYIVYDY